MTNIIPHASFEHVRYAVADNVALIELNRPEVRNALNRRAYDEVESAFRHADADMDVRCVIVTGADPAFCSGEDVKSMMTGEQKDASVKRLTSAQVGTTPAAAAALDCSKPVIAAVNGVAAGAGANLALACDLVIAAESATFVQAFARIGLIPDAGGTSFLPRRVGLQRAMGAALLAEPVSARQAEA